MKKVLFLQQFDFLSSVGNKNDDPDRKVVLTEDALRYARQMDIQLFETSAKDNINVEEMFHAITEKVLTHKIAQTAQNAQSTNDTVNLRKPHGKKKNKCCQKKNLKIEKEKLGKICLKKKKYKKLSVYY